MSAKRMFIALMLSLPMVATAGTPGLTGTHQGYYDLKVRTNSGLEMAESYQSYPWEFNFDTGTASFSEGYIVSPLSLIPLKYKAHPPIYLQDNGDGTYTASYTFQALNPLYGNPQAATATTFEITQTASGLSIETLDSDGDGVPGETIHGVFPYDIELDWSGTTN